MLPCIPRVLQFNPQPSPHNAMSCTTSAYFSSPRGLLSRWKTWYIYSHTVEVVGSNPTAPSISFLGLARNQTPRAQPTTQPQSPIQLSLDHLRGHLQFFPFGFLSVENPPFPLPRPKLSLNRENSSKANQDAKKRTNKSSEPRFRRLAGKRQRSQPRLRQELTSDSCQPPETMELHTLYELSFQI